MTDEKGPLSSSDDRVPALIKDLTRQLEPVGRLSQPATTVLQWALMSTIFVVMAVWVLGRRADLWLRLQDPSFVVESLLILVFAFSVGYLSLAFAVPGRMRWKRVAQLFCGVSGLWVGALTARFAVTGSFDGEEIRGLVMAPACVADMLLIGVAPTLVLVARLQHRRSTHPRRNLFLAVAAGLAFGALGLQMTCSLDGVAHLMVWHALPLVGLSLVGFAFGRRFLMW